MGLYRPYSTDLGGNPHHVSNTIDIRKKLAQRYDMIFSGLVPHQHIQLISKLSVQILQPRVIHFIEDTFDCNIFGYYKNDIINIIYDRSEYINALEEKYASYFIGTKDTHHLFPRSQGGADQGINTIEWNIKKHAQFHHYFVNAYYSEQVAMIIAIAHPIFHKSFTTKIKRITESTPKKIFIKDALKSI